MDTRQESGCQLHNFFRVLRSSLLLLFWLCLLTQLLQGEENKNAGPPTTLSDDFMLLCVVRLGGATLEGNLVTYTAPPGLFLPLGELSRSLELGITVEPTKGNGTGHVANPSQPFRLDMVSSSITVSGKSYRYDTALVVALPDDIYVESKLLAEWLAMRIDANRLDAAIDIRPFMPLPIQERMARSQRGSNTWGYGNYNDSGYPMIDTPYRLLAGPSINLNLSSSLTGEKSGEITPLNTSYYTRIMGDFLWMSGRLDLSGQIAASGKSIIGITNSSLLLERENPSGDMLALLGARKVAIGDIQPETLPLIGNSVGAGFMISNYPLNQSSFFDKLTLRGFLAKGWDVELYSNANLLDYRPSNPQESYAFVDIPLVYGLNELRLIFHGPQGEKRVESHIYNVGRNMIEPGSFNYQLTASNASLPSLLTSPIGDPAPLMTWKSTLGVSKWLTESNYLASFPIDGQRQNFAGAGFSGYLKMIQLDMQMARNLATSQWARQAGAQTSLGPISLSATMQDYDKDWHTTTGTISYLRKWDVRLDGLNPLFFLSNSRFSMTLAQTEYDALRKSKSAIMTSSQRTWGIDHRHTLTVERTEDAGTESDAVSGSSYASLTHRSLALRAEIDYQLLPLRTINTVGTTCELRLPNEWLLVNSMTYTPLSKTVTASMGLTHTFNAMAMGLTGNYTAGGSWNIGLQLSTNISHDGQSGQWKADGSMSSQQAAISALAYLDSNHNKEWNTGESVIKDAGFMVNQQSHRTTTGSDGIAFLQGLSPNTPTDIALSPSTLKELLWVPADKGIRVVARPGNAASVKFPVWITGEISGTVYRKKEGIDSPVSGINIEAINMEEKVIGKARSEYDGLYILAALPTGKYTVRISPDQAVKLGTTSPLKQVTIPPEGSYVDNINLVLEELPVLPSGYIPTESTEEAPVDYPNEKHLKTQKP
ncbi:MAG: carboxypeptidase-like regulatory domain-containing protein [Pelodictyon phaeoclathratiforme]